MPLTSPYRPQVERSCPTKESRLITEPTPYHEAARRQRNAGPPPGGDVRAKPQRHCAACNTRGVYSNCQDRRCRAPASPSPSGAGFVQHAIVVRLFADTSLVDVAIVRNVNSIRKHRLI